jgi:ZIP family zinc transporter
MKEVATGLAASLLAGACTGLGAAAVFGIRKLTPKLEDALLSGAAGIMLAASFFSLILPGIAQAERLVGHRSSAVAIVIVGILLGALLVFAMHRYLPHEHFVRGREGRAHPRLSRVWLFVFTITLHNLPEGMAVGVGFGDGGFRSGFNLALGIGLQNIPEGLAVAAALITVGYSRTQAFLISTLTGVVEGAGGLIAVLALWLAAPALPLTLGLAAGAMLFIISDEIIPETHGRGNQGLATFSLLLGFVVMMFLDATMG